MKQEQRDVLEWENKRLGLLPLIWTFMDFNSIQLTVTETPPLTVAAWHLPPLI